RRGFEARRGSNKKSKSTVCLLSTLPQLGQSVEEETLALKRECLQSGRRTRVGRFDSFAAAYL
ncbi:MAG TPA: hypothetical protein VMF32_19670, partial [Xanthobacteraceae bacterium]|nr:hypothetical protein [Xanthobacteraceae bacterium]